MYICENCGAHLDPGEKCDCSGAESAHTAACRGRQTETKRGSQSISDKDENSDESGKVFMIRAVRCRRCNGILTSDFGIKNGIGQCCRQKELAQTPDKNQIALF